MNGQSTLGGKLLGGELLGGYLLGGFPIFNTFSATFFASYENNSYSSAVGNTFDDMFTLYRSSTATYTDVNGVIQTAAINEPRFDYSTGKRGFMNEGWSTNLMVYSEDMTQWSQSPNNSLTVTANQTTAPDGQTTADLIVPTTDTNNHLIFKIHSGGAISTTYTASAYVKPAGYNYAFIQLANTAYPTNLYAIFDIENGVLTEAGGNAESTSITSAGNGWYRISVTGTSDADGGNYVASLQPRPTGSFTATFTGDGTSGVYMWGYQVEQKQFPTSYIPTTSTTVTRAADVLTVTPAQMTGSILTIGGAMPTAVSFQMNGKISYADNNDNGEALFLVWNLGSTPANYITDRLATGTGTGQVSLWQNENGTFAPIFSDTNLYSPGVNVDFNFASRHADTSVGGAVDGVALTPNTTPTVLPDLSSTFIRIGQILDGVIYNFQAWDSELDDTTLEQVTS